MEFPVDILATVDPESLEQSAKDYMSKLLYRNSEIHEYLSIPGSKKIEIGLCNVSFVPLYGVDIKQKVLALFSPEDPFKAVGLYLLDQWWSAEDILKTADSSRTGLIKVRTPGERIVLYVLNRIIYRTKEMAGDDVPFLCHGEGEIAKIFWKNGEAIGFYSVQPEGRLCNSFLTQRYQLPVMDTIFIRKCHRGNGHGLQMLKDFTDSFKKDFMGLKYPLSPAMYKVCKKYLSLYPDDTELLWEIEGVGSPFQRTQIARKLQAMDLKGVQDTPVTARGRSSNLKHIKLGADTEETTEQIIRVEDIEPDVQCVEDEDSKLSLNLKGPELKDTMETMTHDVTPRSEITHLHCEEQNKLTPEPTSQSETEKEQGFEITPVMEIKSLKGNEDAQIMTTFEATIVPIDLQPLELQQVEELESVKLSTETEEVKEKAGEAKEIKDDVDKEIPSDGKETAEEIVELQKHQTDMAETTNKEDTKDEEEMGKISVVENIVDDTEAIQVEKEETGALEVSLVEKEQSEQVKEKETVEETGTVQECLCEKDQETEDQEPSPDNEEEKVSTLIQQEETSNMAYSSGSKGKHGDKRISNYETPVRRSRRLNDQAAESDLTERVLRSSSKKTCKVTSEQVYTRETKSLKQLEEIKQVEDEPKEKGLIQTESQAQLTEKEQVEEIAENKNVEGKIESVSTITEVYSENLIATVKDNEEEINIEKNCLDQLTDDQNLMEVDNKMEDSFQEENKMDEKLRNEEQDKETAAAAEEVGKTTKDGEEIGIVDVNNAEASEIMIDGKASEPSAAEHIEEETASETVPAEDDNNTEAALKRQKAAVALTEPTEKQQVVAMADSENVVVVEDKIKNSNIEETEVRHDKIEIEENIISKDDGVPEPTLTDENKMEECQEEEPMKDANMIQSEEPKINDINLSLDREVGKTNKDGEKIGVVDVHDAEDVNAAEIEVEGRVPEPSAAEEQEEVPASEMVPAETVQNTEETTSTLKLQKIAVVLVDLDKDFTTHTDASKDAKGTSQPESTDDRENKEADGLNQKVEPSEKEQEVEMRENENVTAEVMGKIENGSIEETEEMSKTEERVITMDVDRVSEMTTDENKMEEFQEEKALKETKTVQDTPDEEIKSKDIIESSEDDQGVKSDDQIELSEEEEDKTNLVTPLLHSRRLKQQAAKRKLTKRVLRSSTKAAKATSKPKAIKQQVKTKQAVDDPEVEQMKEVVESHTGTAVEEKVESVSITTDDCSENLISALNNDVEEERNVDEEHLEEKITDYKNLMEVENKMKDSSQHENKTNTAEIEVEGKTPEQSTAEPVEEQKEEPASEMVPKEEVQNTEETTAALKLSKAAVVLVDFNKVSMIYTDVSEDAKGPSQPQEEVDLELQKPESTDTESQAEHTEIEQTDTAQEIPGEEPKSLHVIESSEDEEGERSDVPIKLNEEEQDEASSVTPLRRSRRLKDQAAESELTKRVLRSSARLTNKVTPQQRHKQQIKAMMLQEAPEQQDESKNNEMSVILGSEVAVGEHMESETVHVFAEGDLGNMISAVQTTCEEGSNLEKGDIEADDHKNIKNIRASHGNEVEETISSEDITEQDKMAPEDIIHGEAEQICTSGEKSAAAIELSEVVKEIEDKVQEQGAVTEMVDGEDSENVMDTTSALTLQEASVVLLDVKKVLPSLTDDCSSAFETAQEERHNKLEMSKQAVDMPEEMKEELQTEVVEGENIKIVNPTERDPSDLNTAAKDTAEDEKNVVMSHLEDETTDTSKLEDEKYSDESKVEEESKTEQVTLQDPILTQDSVLEECSETTTHVQDILALHNTEVVKDNISVEEQEEEVATELAPEEDRENVGESTSMLKLHKAAVVLVDFQRQTDGNETDGNKITQSQEVASLTKENEEKAVVEMNVTEPVTERIEQEEAVELGMDNTIIRNDEQDRDILAEGVKDDLKEAEDTTLNEKSTLTELDTDKTLKECQESTAHAQGDSVQESSQDVDISVYTSRNLRLRTLPVKPTPERKSRCLQDIYKETKVNENTEEEISDEEVETVFTRHLRRRTVTVTPRRRAKHLMGTRVAEPEMGEHVTKVCHEIVAVQSIEEARTGVEEMRETNSKYDSEEVPADSAAVRKDQQQDKNIPGNDTEKVEEVTRGGKGMVEEAVDHKEVETTDREILAEGDLPDKEKEEPDELNQEQVRSANSKQENDQQDNAVEEMLLKKTFEKELGKGVEEKHLAEEKDSTVNISITEAILDQSEESVGVDRRSLRKRTITIKAASVRKSKRLRKQDQSENDGRIVVWANSEDSAPVEATVMEMADVKSPAENETIDQGKVQEIEDTNTIGGEISHKDEDQENAEGEETYGNASNSQESTVIEDMSKQAQLSEFPNVSEEDTDTKLVVQDEEKGKENREEQSATEEIMESENNAGKADKVADEPKEFEDTQEELEQSKKNAEETTEASVTVDENFTLELDEEIDSNDAECNQVAEETKASFQESVKEITDAEQVPGVLTKHILRGRKSATASPEQRSNKSSRRLLQDSQSEMEERSEAEEVKEVIGEEEKKPQQKRKAVVELTPRRSKRLARAEIV
ncbi:hypothetical protein PGIGA_G00147680 [Pangasianodon gigas]|uniref:Uncharacterized protein n=1 Tax=Pangasianodon gigas TaxID=30993 RepID=A0ACC5XMS2_PANGG|nr:hypothetical protein [Pangasianodon gigas]